MSVFRVKLQSNEQGQLDRQYTTASLIANGATPGTQYPVSFQRQAFIMGPRHNQMLLKDGATFTSNNYWKRFCYPQCPLNSAILNIISDDGSVYSDVGEESGGTPYSYTKTLAATTTYTTANNILDILGDHGGAATFTQISNNDTADSVTVQINGTATMTIPAASTQVFNSGDLRITKLAFANASAGTVDIEVLVSVSNLDSQVTDIHYLDDVAAQGTVFPLAGNT